MTRVPRAILIGLVAAIGLAACGAPRVALMPAPPSEVRKEAGAPPAAAGERAAPTVPPESAPRAKTGRQEAAAPPVFDWLTRYIAAYEQTRRAIALGAPRDAVASWREIEDSKWGTDAVYNQGVLFQLAGDLEEAAAQYTRATERSPAFQPPLVNLLGISLLRGDRRRMASLLARVAPRGSTLPSDMLPELAVNAAAALMETGRPDEASQLLLSLRWRGKATPALPWNLAVLSFRRGDSANARKLAETVPSGVADLFPVVASRFAWAREGEKIPELGAAPPSMPGMAALSVNLAAFAEYRAGNAAAAEKILAPTAAGDAVGAEIITNLGILQAEQGRWDAARKTLERAVRQDPELSAAWLNLGIFRELYEGNRSGARECYDNYVKLKGWRMEEVRKWSDRLGRSASQGE